MHNPLAGFALSVSLSLAALDASAQVDPNAPPPPPPIANPPGSPWGSPPPPPPGAPDAQPVYAAPQPVYVMQAPQQPYGRMRPTRVLYEGGPVPPGGRLETRARLGLTIGGGVTFGVTWLLTATIGGLAASIDDSFSGGSRSPAWWLMVPVIGPIGFGVAEGSVASPGWFILGLDAVAQGAGLAMLIYGLANPATYVVFDGRARREAPARPRWAVVPGSAATPHGATFALTF
jgi:hypothetical protein